jgi:hypothetical protein
MSSTFRRTGSMAIAVMALAALASAQESTGGDTWTHGTTLNAFAGVASEPTAGAATAGGAIGWQMTPSLSFEGTGAWINSQSSSPWFSAALKVQTRLAHARGANPFVEGGIGLYQASFDAGQADVPEFYRKRMTEQPGGSVMSHSFTDPTIVFGGGLNVLATRHFALRPTVEVTMVLRNSDSYTTTAAVLRLAYFFENHPVTPTRRSR